jgi:hypothetical protein
MRGQHIGHFGKNAAMPEPHHLAKPELQAKILEMLKGGVSQNAIARKLHKSPGTIGHHVKSLRMSGKYLVPTLEYLEPERTIRGKRKCPECGKSKSLGAFPNERSARCTVCARARRG